MILILAYRIYPVNRKAVLVRESLVSMLCQWYGQSEIVFVPHLPYSKGLETLEKHPPKSLANLFLVLGTVFGYTKNIFERKR